MFWRCSLEKVFLEILQTCNFIKKATLVQAFSCEYAKFVWTLFLIERHWWLLLEIANLRRTSNIYIFFVYNICQTFQTELLQFQWLHHIFTFYFIKVFSFCRGHKKWNFDFTAKFTIANLTLFVIIVVYIGIVFQVCQIII